MARGNDGAGALIGVVIILAIFGFILKLFAIVVIWAAVASPFILAMTWMITALTLGRLSAPPGNNAFGFTPDEQVEFDRSSLSAATLEGMQHALLAQGAHLSTRNDGQFQERTPLAKDLNRQIQSLRPQVASARNVVNEFAVRPDRRKANYVSAVARLRVSTTALVVCIVVMNVLMLANLDVFSGLNTIIARALNSQGTVNLFSMILSVGTGGGVIGWLYYAARIGSRIAVERECVGRLPSVSADVVAQYSTVVKNAFGT